MGSIFSPKAPAVQAPPPAPPPAPMPAPEGDPQVEAARRKKVAAQRTRSGRASTILSQGGGAETLGGG